MTIVTDVVDGESVMQSAVGQILLVIYSFFTVLAVPADTGLVVAFLGTVVYLSAVNVEALQGARPAFMAVFLLLSCFVPKFLLFAPAVLYSILECRKYVFAAVLGVLCVYFYLKPQPELFFLLLFGCVASAFLQRQAERYARLEELFCQTQDDGTELNILLQEKNRNILARQDDEIYTATLKERNRIAREIHDHVGHMLSRAILMVGAMKAVNREEAMKEPLAQLEDTLNAAMTNVRASVHDLYDDSVDLREVLEGLAAEYTFCEAALTYDMGNVVPREVKYSFIAIVKEALSNTARHSDASRVEIVAREHPGLYQLIIRDNGTAPGTDAGAWERLSAGASSGGGSGGIGLRNMKDRVGNLGGKLQVSAEKGFRIFITVPKKEEMA